ncbi:UDP-N-acetylmuramoyl-L-alanyl-D-glutamate--2,6-diaminopimelate ligase [Patescibacteria group bacterium]|nr:UDP-N-acetylmuramoyl-L-alanyl-D-glutamate--2,6-diaminopimelate ligase [Patescibacteria group bacterium]
MPKLDFFNSLNDMKQAIKKIIPKSLLSFYHKTLAKLAAFYYGHPADSMVVIGVTGTKGKSSVCNMIWEILTEAGFKTGLTSTMNFRIGEKEWKNKYKMTMLGRFKLQKLLKEMKQASCQYVIVETSSEGISQWRHLGINYDMAVFLNLSPEHIEAHGGFDNYKKAKGRLFEHLTSKQKLINGEKIPKIIVANEDDKEGEYFMHFPADKKVGFKFSEEPVVLADGVSFKFEGLEINSKLLGRFNAENMMAAATVAKALGIKNDVIKQGLEKIEDIPGRLERIEEGQDYDVIVDYAYEPRSFENILKLIKGSLIKEGRLIVVTGSCGGGRDVARRGKMGELAAKYADFVVVTNEDPYDDDPQEIIKDVAEGVKKAGKHENVELFSILDREKGIEKALELAKKGDIVLIAGKGCEPVMAVAGGKYMPWDDRDITRKLLRNS